MIDFTVVLCAPLDKCLFNTENVGLVGLFFFPKDTLNDIQILTGRKVQICLLLICQFVFI